MRLREDVIQRPDGSQGIHSYVEKPDFALIIPVDRDGFHLVEQYRYPVSHRSWEFPQGTLPHGRMGIQRHSPGENRSRRQDSGRDGSTVSATFIPLRS